VAELTKLLGEAVDALYDIAKEMQV
jgi:hypothetical protein